MQASLETTRETVRADGERLTHENDNLRRVRGQLRREIDVLTTARNELRTEIAG